MENSILKIFLAFDHKDDNTVLQHLNDPSRLFECLPVINKIREQLFGKNKTWKWIKNLQDFNGLQVVLINIEFPKDKDITMNIKKINDFDFDKYKSFKLRAKLESKASELLDSVSSNL